MKIGWGITGAGHYMRNTYDIIEKLIGEGHKLEVFFSAAGEAVANMFGIIKKLEELHHKDKKLLKHLVMDQAQRPAYPICARFNLKRYDLLVLSPLTANSVAKINVGIADTLITNIFAQMLKGNGKILIVPCDLIAGDVETEIPSGELVKVHIDSFNSDNAKKLTQFPNVEIFATPEEVYEKIEEIK
jgi:dihydromethanopterin reductase (acceptor)